MKQSFEVLYTALMAAYYKCGRIGNVKPYNLDHAKKIAWNAAQRIINNK